MADLDAATDDSVDAVRAKERRFADLVASSDYLYGQQLADAWCAAFVWRKTPDVTDAITEDRFRRLEKNPFDAPVWTRDEIRRLATESQFFHWHLAFPEVFRPKADPGADANDPTGWTGGFDVVLGNPPWDQAQVSEKEFFAERAPEIAAAAGERRKQCIEELERQDPSLDIPCFPRLPSRGRCCGGPLYQLGPLSARRPGKLNSYALFAELNRSLIQEAGRSGCIVPSGIATDDPTKTLFAALSDGGNLASLYDFQASPGLFGEIGHARFKFCLLTLRGRDGRKHPPADFAFFLRDVDHLVDPDRRFELSAADFGLLNPNTRTCPIFRSRRDAEITKAVYRRVPVLINEALAAAR